MFSSHKSAGLLLLLLVAAPSFLFAQEEDAEKTSSTVSVTMLGLGAMGCAAAEYLASQEQFELTVWNRSPGKCDALPDSVTRASSVSPASDKEL